MVRPSEVLGTSGGGGGFYPELAHLVVRQPPVGESESGAWSFGDDSDA